MTDQSFDPHVVGSILLILVAIFVAMVVAIVPVEDDPIRRRENRK